MIRLMLEFLKNTKMRNRDGRIKKEKKLEQKRDQEYKVELGKQ